MMTENTLRPPFTDPADILLADVAIRIQLSKTDYNKATQRYQTINAWAERDESPLKGRVELFYPQGSMAIGATIASKLKTDEFDIDVVDSPVTAIVGRRDEVARLRLRKTKIKTLDPRSGSGMTERGVRDDGKGEK